MSGNKIKNDRRLQRVSEPANRKDRTLSEISVSSSVQLSGYTKNALLGMQNAKDPFSRESQEAIEEFHDFVMNFSSHVGVNLEECALLLQSSTKLFGRQVKDASKCMADLAAFVTNTMAKVSSPEEDGKEKKGRQKNKLKEQTGEDGAHQTTENEESSNAAGVESTVAGIDGTEVIDNLTSEVNPVTEITNATGDLVVEGSEMTTTMDGTDGNTTVISDTQAEMDTAVQSGDNAEIVYSTSACDTVETGQSTILNLEGTLSEDPAISGNQAEIINPFTSAHTTSEVILSTGLRKGLKRLAKEKSDDSTPKKSRLKDLPPPTLISIFDLDLEASADVDDMEFDDYPPILFPEVDLWNGQFQMDADPDARPVLVNKHSNNNSSPENIQNSIPDIVPTVADGSVVPSDKTDILLVSSVVRQVNGIVLQGTDTTVEFPVLSPEDQQEIQNCINQLHYLPFTCELSKGELARTFHNTVEHLETIFKKYNLPFNRQLLKDTIQMQKSIVANMVSTFSNAPSNGSQSPVNQEALNNFREIFSQGPNELQDETLAALVNSESSLHSGKTVLERTKEKSVAESRATVQKRLYEMQRLIVPKYIQLPLIQENTPEFFRRVKQFEQKMKKVLADEEKKESFDVSKYEIEVLAATADLESQEDEFSLMDDSGEDTNASSQNSTIIPDYIMDEPLINERILMPGMLSPTSASNSPSSCDFGRKWVPLSNVFNHMKKFDRNECARHFYAVLALLSSQNLDMNYDRHFSAESAALVTTKLDHSQDSKYPRGVKIMTSRCPDADKEEIYVTALASKSCNETFRDLISHEMNHLQDHEHQSDAQKSGLSRSNSLNYESDDEFIPMSCSVSHTGNLFGGRKKRTN